MTSFLKSQRPAQKPSQPKLKPTVSHGTVDSDLKRIVDGFYADDEKLVKKDEKYPAKELETIAFPFMRSVSELAFAKSVFAPGKTYRFRMIRTATLVSSGTGAMDLATVVYPSQFTQYAALSALFDECRLWSTKISYNFLLAGTVPGTMVSSFDPSGNGSTLTATTAYQIPGAKALNTWTSVNMKVNTHNQYRVSKKQARTWSTVPSSAGGSDPVGGVIGQWNHNLVTVTAATTNVAQYFIEVDYEFRNVA